MLVSRLAAAMIVLFASAAACASGDKSFERQVPAQARGVVDISNVSGTVVVTGWDRPEVSVRAELDEGVERVDVSTDHGRTSIKVPADYPPDLYWKGQPPKEEYNYLLVDVDPGQKTKFTLNRFRPWSAKPFESVEVLK